MLGVFGSIANQSRRSHGHERPERKGSDTEGLASRSGHSSSKSRPTLASVVRASADGGVRTKRRFEPDVDTQRTKRKRLDSLVDDSDSAKGSDPRSDRGSTDRSYSSITRANTQKESVEKRKQKQVDRMTEPQAGRGDTEPTKRIRSDSSWSSLSGGMSERILDSKKRREVEQRKQAEKAQQKKRTALNELQIQLDAILQGALKSDISIGGVKAAENAVERAIQAANDAQNALNTAAKQYTYTETELAHVRGLVQKVRAIQGKAEAFLELAKQEELAKIAQAERARQAERDKTERDKAEREKQDKAERAHAEKESRLAEDASKRAAHYKERLRLADRLNFVEQGNLQIETKAYLETAMSNQDRISKSIGSYKDDTARKKMNEVLMSLEQSIGSIASHHEKMTVLYQNSLNIRTLVRDMVEKAEASSQLALEQQIDVKLANERAHEARSMHDKAIKAFNGLSENLKKDQVMDNLKSRLAENDRRVAGLVERAEVLAANATKEKEEETKKAADEARRALDRAKNATSAAEAKAAADEAEAAAELARKHESISGSTQVAFDKANEYAAAAGTVAEAAAEEEEAAKQKSDEVLKEARARFDRKYSPAELLVLISSLRKSEPLLGFLETPISKRIRDETKAGLEGLLKIKEDEAKEALKKQEAEALETARGEVKSEEDGLAYIIKNTRHAIRGAVDYNDNIDADRVNEKVGNLHDKIDNVGALLYKDQEYVGVAVPVVEKEVHTTRIIEPKDRKHTRHMLITATAMQAASALGYYKPFAGQADPESTDPPDPLSLSPDFLSRILLYDTLKLTDTLEMKTLVLDFQACLGRIEGMQSVMKETTDRDLNANENRVTRPNYLGRDYTRKGIDAVRVDWNNALATYISLASAFNDRAFVTPIGVYDDNVNRHALLVYPLQKDAIVAVTGVDGSVSIYKTHKYTALGALELALDIMPRIVQSDAEALVNEIKRVCGAGKAANTANTGTWRSAVAPDRHLAIRSFGYTAGGIITHTSAIVHSIIWLLGIWHALSKNPGAVDFIIERKQDDARASALLEAVGHIDMEIKKLAVGSLLTGESSETAELVASDYAGCTWLDTKSLREKLVRSTRSDTDQEELVTTCTVIRDGVIPFSVPMGTDLAGLARWIKDNGYVFDVKDYARYTAAVSAFVHNARSVMILPFDGRNVKVKDDDARNILAISSYVSYVRHGANEVYRDVLEGIAMRCVRYITHLVKQSHELPPYDSDAPVSTIMPRTFSTSLPWVAEEYLAMQSETRGVTSLLFAPANMKNLASKYTDQAHKANFLVTSDYFHEGWFSWKQQQVSMHEDMIQNAKQHGLTHDAYERLENAIERLGMYENEDLKFKMSLNDLEGPSLKALRYIQSDDNIAVLNVAAALLKQRAPKSAAFFVFGIYKTNQDVRFLASADSRVMEKAGYQSTEMAKVFQVLYGDDSHTEVQLASNMEYLYKATRECTAMKSTRSTDDQELRLTVTFPEYTISHDIPALVEWVDRVHDAECDYRGRSVYYIIKRHLMPLSAKGPSETSLVRLKMALENMSGPAGPTISIVESMMLLLNGVVPKTKLELSDHEQERQSQRVLISAYMTIAAIKNMLAQVLEEQEEVRLSVITDPDSSWALTPITWRADATLGARHTTKAGTFVFDANGGVVARIHQSLKSAWCRFDHWFKHDVHWIQVSGAEIHISPKKGKAEIRLAKDEQKTYSVYTGHCEWWGKQYGSAVIPVVDDGVTKLVVIPGDYGKSHWSTSFEPTYDRKRGTVSAYLESLPKLPFVVTLDSVGLIPVASTDTDELMRIFVAYAYSGSRIGTRLMQCVAAHSIYDRRSIRVPGEPDTTAHDAIRYTILGSRCPLSFYSAPALVYKALRTVFPRLHCSADELPNVLVQRLMSSAIHESDEPIRRARFSFWAEYGEPERLVAYESAMQKAKKDKDDEKQEELKKLKDCTDEWMTTLSATTGRFVRTDQREKIGLITEIPWSIVQMNMGFGKSSVIVPMLVARYLCRPDTRIVFVTQPPHLVPQAARTVGGLIAAHPFVRSVGGLIAVRTLNVSDITELLHDWRHEIGDRVGNLRCKLVVVLSTAELQCIVRDYTGIYKVHKSIVHIADEVDAESDPLKCEVIIEGTTKQSHYNKSVADPNNIQKYYEAACDLVFAPEVSDASIKALNAICKTGELKAGTRLSSVLESIKDNMRYRVNYGMSSDPAKIAAVPYDYSGTPSLLREFSDIDVASLVLALSIEEGGMRPSDEERLRDHIHRTFGTSTESIMKYLNRKENEKLKKRFYLMQVAMKTIKMSIKETAVSFVDVLGMADTLVGFSGTIGTSIEAPGFAHEDPRFAFSNRPVLTIDDEASNKMVERTILGARLIFVSGEPGLPRANEVIKEIEKDINSDKDPACIVDGSGEFGVFKNDVEELQKGWRDLEYFDEETGVRVRNNSTRKVLYYSHRNSRGTDSEMDDNTIGRTVMSWETSRESEIAQAIFRLRQIKKGQKVVLVVVSKSTLADGDRTNDAVLARLKQNERAYAAAAVNTKEAQMSHAATRKYEKGHFIRDVVYTEVSSIAQKQQEQQAQAQNLVQGEENKRGPLPVNQRTQCYEKTRAVRNEELDLENRATDTSIKDDLMATNIGLSPMVTNRDIAGKGIHRAFALRVDGDVVHVVVIAIVEAWAKYKSTSATSKYAYYTHDGKFISGRPHDTKQAGAILFGRFLCDDELSIEDEIMLLRYLKERYNTVTTDAAIRAVLKCLIVSKFISSQYKLLMDLAQSSAGYILETVTKDVNGLITKVVGTDRTLKELIAPIIQRALGADTQSFGKKHRRSVRPLRPMRSFV